MKIFYLMECEECNHCFEGTLDQQGWCVEKEKIIPDTETIPDWCGLEDAKKFIEWKRKQE